jgi:hypothetical protein
MNVPTNPLPTPYPVHSKVSTEIFELFLSALKDETSEVTKANLKELSAQCNEFGFELESPSYRIGQLEVALEIGCVTL